MHRALAAALVLASATARAQPAPEHEQKHASTALAISLGSTAAAVGMFALGYKTDRPELLAGGALLGVAAPSFGRWYAGEYSTGGLYLRLGGAALALAGLVTAMHYSWANEMVPDAAAGLAIAGGGLFVGGALYDIGTAPKAVERYNNQHAIGVSPMVTSSGGGPSGFGLSIGGSF